MVSRTGIVYEGGTPPTQTRRSQMATQFLRRNRADRALSLALEGVQADTTNPIHYYLAGLAYLRLGEYGAADSMLVEAERIYPAYAIAIEPEREAAWVQAFNSGIEAFGGGDWETTIDRWREATLVYDLRPDAHATLANVLAADGQYDSAIAVYRQGLSGLERVPVTRTLDDIELEERSRSQDEMELGLLALLLSTRDFEGAEPLLRERLARAPADVELLTALAGSLVGMGRSEEALEIYTQLLSEPSLTATALFNLGVQVFSAGAYPQAAEAFRRLTEIQPDSRDAWYNYVNSLFAAEAWEQLATVGRRLVELDPLGESAQLVTARAHFEVGDRPAALASLERADQAPVYLEALQMQRSIGATTVFGRVRVNTAEPGTPIALRFVFFGDAGESLGSETLAVTAPLPDAATDFEVRFTMSAAAYRYELVAEAPLP